MNEKFIEFLKKPHSSMEDLLEDLMDIDLYLEDDNDDEFKIEDLDKLDQFETNEDEEIDPELDDLLNNEDDEQQQEEEPPLQTEPDEDELNQDDTSSFDDLDSALNFDDDEEESDNDEIDSENNDEIEEEKDKFLYNIRQLIKIRDLLNVAITKTNEKEFIALLKYVNKILSSVASIGEEMYERDDLGEINDKLESFMRDIVDSAKNVLQKYEKEKDKEDNDNLDFDFLDLKGGK